MKLPYEFKCGDFKIDVVGMEASKKIGYIRLESTLGDLEGIYVGSIDRDANAKSLIKLRDALDLMIKERGPQ